MLTKPLYVSKSSLPLKNGSYNVQVYTCTLHEIWSKTCYFASVWNRTDTSEKVSKE